MRSFADMPRSELAAIRVLATDIDDTITRDGRLVPSTLEALSSLGEAGLLVALVTGRSAGWTQAMACYLPAVHVAVGENGLVSFASDGTRTDLGPPRSSAFFATLASNAERVGAAFHLQTTNDDAFRLFERTFVRPPSFDAGTLLSSQGFVESGFEVIASSIHIHVRPSGWSKADGLLAALQSPEGEAFAAPRERILFVGDSSNDRPLFAKLPRTSVGVANVARFLDELGPDRPAFVTQGEGADGFAEVVRRLLEARANC